MVRSGLDRRRLRGSNVGATTSMAELNGARRTTDLPLTYSDIAQLGLEAAARNISMGQLLTDIMCNAIKKKMFDEILSGPSQEPASKAEGA